MVKGVRAAAIAGGLIDEAAWERTTEPDGVFCYTFFKALAIT